jgi:hypothetical protein
MARRPSRPALEYDPLNLQRVVDAAASTPRSEPSTPRSSPRPAELTRRRRPLYGNGEPLAITATSSGTAQTIFTAGAVSDGWDEPSIYVTNTAGAGRILNYDIGGTGTFAQMTIPGNTSMTRLIPSGEDALPFSGGIVIKVYVSGGTGLQVLGGVTEYRYE